MKEQCSRKYSTQSDPSAEF